MRRITPFNFNRNFTMKFYGGGGRDLAECIHWDKIRTYYIHEHGTRKLANKKI